MEFGDWRPGDQRCYVSDIRKAGRDMGWSPEVDVADGLARLWTWVSGAEGPIRPRVADPIGAAT